MGRGGPSSVQPSDSRGRREARDLVSRVRVGHLASDRGHRSASTKQSLMASVGEVSQVLSVSSSRADEEVDEQGRREGFRLLSTSEKGCPAGT